MKTQLLITTAALLASVAGSQGQGNYTNFIRQVQEVSGFRWDMPVEQVGQDLSPLSVDPGGAHFELWTVRNTPYTEYALDHRYVNTYVPVAQVQIYTEDPYPMHPRTRADRPFNVDITVEGLLVGDASAPDAAKAVTAKRFLQSYGDGDGTEIDQEQAILHAQTTLNDNQVHTFQFSLTQIPGADRTKVSGEERFTVMSLQDYQVMPSQLASSFVKIWPVADGGITGLSDGDHIRFSMPEIEITLNDLYPDSETWAQVYHGGPQLGVEGTVVPGSGVVVADSVPQSRVLRIDDWDSAMDTDGQYTMEVLTKTPFGVERLDYVTFTINRTLKVNGAVTTIE